MSYTRSSTRYVRPSRTIERFISVRTPQYEKIPYATYAGHSLKTVGDSRTGVNNPGWRLAVVRHQNASSGFSAWKKTYQSGFGVDMCSWYDYRYINGKNVAVPQYEAETGALVYVNTPGAFPDFPSDTADRARAKLYKDAVRAMNSMRVLTTIGELRETLRMLRNPGKALSDSIRDYLKRVTKHARRAPVKSRKRIIRESYLEATFGWAPFIGDIRAAGSALNRRLDRWQGIYTRVSGLEIDRVHTVSPNWTSGIGGLVTKRRWDVETHASKLVRYYGEVRSVNPNPVLADMRLLGVTWEDLILTGWELVPWSFVMDYFTNIGDVLESWGIRDNDWAWLTSVTKYYVRLITTNVRTEDWHVVSYPGYVPELGHRRHMACSPARATYSTVSRATPLTGPAELAFKWDLGVGGRQALNLVALGDARIKYQRAISRR